MLFVLFNIKQVARSMKPEVRDVEFLTYLVFFYSEVLLWISSSLPSRDDEIKKKTSIKKPKCVAVDLFSRRDVY